MHNLLFKFLLKVLPRDDQGRFIADKGDKRYRITFDSNDVVIENIDTGEKEIKSQVLFFKELKTGFLFRKKQKKALKKSLR